MTHALAAVAKNTRIVVEIINDNLQKRMIKCMENKKKLCVYLIMLILTVGLIVTTLFVPIASVISKTMDSSQEVIDEASGTFNLLGFTNATGPLFGASYEAVGPVWLSILGVILNWLVLGFAALFLGFLVFELCTFKNNKFLLKQNMFTKKLGFVLGYFCASVAVFEIVAFSVTTALADGYFIYSLNVQIFVSLLLGLGIVVCAYLFGKKTNDLQTQNKVRDSLAFGLVVVFSALFLVFIFVSKTIDGLSFWNMSSLANEIHEPVAAEYFIGISQWATFALFFVAGFLLVYCLIGLIKSLKGKNINWLSGAVKRWSMAWLIICIVYLFLMTATTIVLYGCVWFDGNLVLSPLTFVMIVLTIIPYFISTNIPRNKSQKNN